jgi:hypothetical protein
MIKPDETYVFDFRPNLSGESERQHTSVNFCGEELIGKSLPSTPTKGIMIGAANAFGWFMLLVRVSISVPPAIMISSIPGRDYKCLHSDPIISKELIRMVRTYLNYKS